MQRRNRIDIAPRAMLFAAGVVLSLMLISLMSGQYEDAKRLSEAVGTNMQRLTRNIENSSVMQYDGLTVSGNEVVNLCSRYADSDGMQILIDYSGQGRTTDVLTVSGMSVNDLRDYGSWYYVNPSGSWRCSIDLNENDVITAMRFTVV